MSAGVFEAPAEQPQSSRPMQLEPQSPSPLQPRPPQNGVDGGSGSRGSTPTGGGAALRFRSGSADASDSPTGVQRESSTFSPSAIRDKKAYIQQHQLHHVLDDMFKKLLQDQPSDPEVYIAEFLARAALTQQQQNSNGAAAAVERNVDDEDDSAGQSLTESQKPDLDVDSDTRSREVSSSHSKSHQSESMQNAPASAGPLEPDPNEPSEVPTEQQQNAPAIPDFAEAVESPRRNSGTASSSSSVIEPTKPESARITVVPAQTLISVAAEKSTAGSDSDETNVVHVGEANTASTRSVLSKSGSVDSVMFKDMVMDVWPSRLTCFSAIIGELSDWFLNFMYSTPAGSVRGNPMEDAESEGDEHPIPGYSTSNTAEDSLSASDHSIRTANMAVLACEVAHIEVSAFSLLVVECLRRAYESTMVDMVGPIMQQRAERALSKSIAQVSAMSSARMAQSGSNRAHSWKLHIAKVIDKVRLSGNSFVQTQEILRFADEMQKYSRGNPGALLPQDALADQGLYITLSCYLLQALSHESEDHEPTNQHLMFVAETLTNAWREEHAVNLPPLLIIPTPKNMAVMVHIHEHHRDVLISATRAAFAQVSSKAHIAADIDPGILQQKLFLFAEEPEAPETPQLAGLAESGLSNRSEDDAPSLVEKSTADRRRTNVGLYSSSGSCVFNLLNNQIIGELDALFMEGARRAASASSESDTSEKESRKTRLRVLIAFLRALGRSIRLSKSTLCALSSAESGLSFDPWDLMEAVHSTFAAICQHVVQSDDSIDISAISGTGNEEPVTYLTSDDIALISSSWFAVTSDEAAFAHAVDEFLREEALSMIDALGALPGINGATIVHAMNKAIDSLLAHGETDMRAAFVLCLARDFHSSSILSSEAQWKFLCRCLGNVVMHYVADDRVCIIASEELVAMRNAWLAFVISVQSTFMSITAFVRNTSAMMDISLSTSGVPQSSQHAAVDRREYSRSGSDAGRASLSTISQTKPATLAILLAAFGNESSRTVAAEYFLKYAVSYDPYLNLKAVSHMIGFLAAVSAVACESVSPAEFIMLSGDDSVSENAKTMMPTSLAKSLIWTTYGKYIMSHFLELRLIMLCQMTASMPTVSNLAFKDELSGSNTIRCVRLLDMLAVQSGLGDRLGRVDFISHAPVVNGACKILTQLAFSPEEGAGLERTAALLVAAADCTSTRHPERITPVLCEYVKGEAVDAYLRRSHSRVHERCPTRERIARIGALSISGDHEVVLKAMDTCVVGALQTLTVSDAGSAKTQKESEADMNQVLAAMFNAAFGNVAPDDSEALFRELQTSPFPELAMNYSVVIPAMLNSAADDEFGEKRKLSEGMGNDRRGNMNDYEELPSECFLRFCINVAARVCTVRSFEPSISRLVAESVSVFVVACWNPSQHWRHIAKALHTHLVRSPSFFSFCVTLEGGPKKEFQTTWQALADAIAAEVTEVKSLAITVSAPLRRMLLSFADMCDTEMDLFASLCVDDMRRAESIQRDVLNALIFAVDTGNSNTSQFTLERNAIPGVSDHALAKHCANIHFHVSNCLLSARVEIGSTAPSTNLLSLALFLLHIGVTRGAGLQLVQRYVRFLASCNQSLVFEERLSLYRVGDALCHKLRACWFDLISCAKLADANVVGWIESIQTATLGDSLQEWGIFAHPSDIGDLKDYLKEVAMGRHNITPSAALLQLRNCGLHLHQLPQLRAAMLQSASREALLLENSFSISGLRDDEIPAAMRPCGVHGWLLLIEEALSFAPGSLADHTKSISQDMTSSAAFGEASMSGTTMMDKNTKESLQLPMDAGGAATEGSHRMPTSARDGGHLRWRRVWNDLLQGPIGGKCCFLAKQMCASDSSIVSNMISAIETVVLLPLLEQDVGKSAPPAVPAHTGFWGGDVISKLKSRSSFTASAMDSLSDPNQAAHSSSIVATNSADRLVFIFKLFNLIQGVVEIRLQKAPAVVPQMWGALKTKEGVVMTALQKCGAMIHSDRVLEVSTDVSTTIAELIALPEKSIDVHCVALVLAGVDKHNVHSFYKELVKDVADAAEADDDQRQAWEMWKFATASLVKTRLSVYDKDDLANLEKMWDGCNTKSVARANWIAEALDGANAEIASTKNRDGRIGSGSIQSPSAPEAAQGRADASGLRVTPSLSSSIGAILASSNLKGDSRPARHLVFRFASTGHGLPAWFMVARVLFETAEQLLFKRRYSVDDMPGKLMGVLLALHALAGRVWQLAFVPTAACSVAHSYSARSATSQGGTSKLRSINIQVIKRVLSLDATEGIAEDDPSRAVLINHIIPDLVALLASLTAATRVVNHIGEGKRLARQWQRLGIPFSVVQRGISAVTTAVIVDPKSFSDCEGGGSPHVISAAYIVGLVEPFMTNKPSKENIKACLTALKDDRAAVLRRFKFNLKGVQYTPPEVVGHQSAEKFQERIFDGLAAVAASYNEPQRLLLDEAVVELQMILSYSDLTEAPSCRDDLLAAFVPAVLESMPTSKTQGAWRYVGGRVGELLCEHSKDSLCAFPPWTDSHRRRFVSLSSLTKVKTDDIVSDVSTALSRAQQSDNNAPFRLSSSVIKFISIDDDVLPSVVRKLHVAVNLALESLESSPEESEEFVDAVQETLDLFITTKTAALPLVSVRVAAFVLLMSLITVAPHKEQQALLRGVVFSVAASVCRKYQNEQQAAYDYLSGSHGRHEIANRVTQLIASLPEDIDDRLFDDLAASPCARLSNRAATLAYIMELIKCMPAFVQAQFLLTSKSADATPVPSPLGDRELQAALDAIFTNGIQPVMLLKMVPLILKLLELKMVQTSAGQAAGGGDSAPKGARRRSIRTMTKQMMSQDVNRKFASYMLFATQKLIDWMAAVVGSFEQLPPLSNKRKSINMRLEGSTAVQPSLFYVNLLKLESGFKHSVALDNQARALTVAVEAPNDNVIVDVWYHHANAVSKAYINTIRAREAVEQHQGVHLSSLTDRVAASIYRRFRVQSELSIDNATHVSGWTVSTAAHACHKLNNTSLARAEPTGGSSQEHGKVTFLEVLREVLDVHRAIFEARRTSLAMLSLVCSLESVRLSVIAQRLHAGWGVMMLELIESQAILPDEQVAVTGVMRSLRISASLLHKVRRSRKMVAQMIDVRELRACLNSALWQDLIGELTQMGSTTSTSVSTSFDPNSDPKLMFVHALKEFCVGYEGRPDKLEEIVQWFETTSLYLASSGDDTSRSIATLKHVADVFCRLGASPKVKDEFCLMLTLLVFVLREESLGRGTEVVMFNQTSGAPASQPVHLQLPKVLVSWWGRASHDESKERRGRVCEKGSADLTMEQKSLIKRLYRTLDIILVKYPENLVNAANHMPQLLKSIKRHKLDLNAVNKAFHGFGIAMAAESGCPAPELFTVVAMLNRTLQIQMEHANIGSPNVGLTMGALPSIGSSAPRPFPHSEMHTLAYVWAASIPECAELQRETGRNLAVLCAQRRMPGLAKEFHLRAIQLFKTIHLAVTTYQSLTADSSKTNNVKSAVYTMRNELSKLLPVGQQFSRDLVVVFESALVDAFHKVLGARMTTAASASVVTALVGIRDMISAPTVPGADRDVSRSFASGRSGSMASEHLGTSAVRFITADEVEEHNQKDDCWVIVHNEVYNVTDFIHKHPGGVVAIAYRAGEDITSIFESTHKATGDARKILRGYHIGSLEN